MRDGAANTKLKSLLESLKERRGELCSSPGEDSPLDTRSSQGESSAPAKEHFGKVRYISSIKSYEPVGKEQFRKLQTLS